MPAAAQGVDLSAVRHHSALGARVPAPSVASLAAAGARVVACAPMGTLSVFLATSASRGPFWHCWLILTLLVFTVALPLCIWDLSTHKHERRYIGARHCPRPPEPRANPPPVWFISGLFVLLSVPVSTHGVQARARERLAGVRGRRPSPPLRPPHSPPRRHTLSPMSPRSCRSTWSASCGCPSCVRLPLRRTLSTRSRTATDAAPPPDGFDSWLSLRFKSGTIYLDSFRECYEAFVLYHFLQARTLVRRTGRRREEAGSRSSLLSHSPLRPVPYPSF